MGKKIKFFKNNGGEEYQIAGNFIHPCTNQHIKGPHLLIMLGVSASVLADFKGVASKEAEALAFKGTVHEKISP